MISIFYFITATSLFFAFVFSSASLILALAFFLLSLRWLLNDCISSSSICYARSNPFLCSRVSSSNSLICYRLWSISIWNRSISRFLSMNSCIGSVFFTRFLIALLAASMRLLLQSAVYILVGLASSSCSAYFVSSFRSFMVRPSFALWPFYQILRFWLASLSSFFLSFSRSFIRKISLSSGT